MRILIIGGVLAVIFLTDKKKADPPSTPSVATGPQPGSGSGSMKGGPQPGNIPNPMMPPQMSGPNPFPMQTQPQPMPTPMPIPAPMIDPPAPKVVPPAPKVEPPAPKPPAPVGLNRPAPPKPVAKVVKLAVPDQAAQDTAEKALKEEFKAFYDKPKPEDHLNLAVKLLQPGRENRADPAAWYVLLREARRSRPSGKAQVGGRGH